MKKNKTYYTENNQEDEDVYTLYPSSAIVYKDAKRQDEIDYRNDADNSKSPATKMQFRPLAPSDPMIPCKIIELQKD